MAQNAHDGKYLRLIDSADNHLEEFPKVATLYLDSIPKPLEESIKGHLACYYEIRAFINDKNEERVLQYQNNLLALKHAQLEKNYDAAGLASLDLFYNTSRINKDTISANMYLRDAKKYFELSNNVAGLADVSQMYAYKAVNEDDYKKSNKILLKHLNAYKNIKDDAYYYLYALFILTKNYIYLDDLNEANKYFDILKSLKGNRTLSPSTLYKSHVVTIYGCFSDYYFKKKNIDSTLFYFSQSEKMRSAMDETDVKNHYNLYVDYYDYIKDYEAKNNYIDSLRIFEEKELAKIVDATIEVNKVLLDSELELKDERKEKRINQVWIIILLLMLLFGSGFYIFKNKKSRKLIKGFEKSTDEYTYLKTNHEKLKVKVKGMEDYISEVKKEVKSISSVANINDQHNQVKELYKNIHHNSSTLLSKSEDHLDLINELNVNFFNGISVKHPNLNPSELIVCYYLFMGFKSKDIAAFINTSVRAVESKRYRITNKLNLKEKGYKLVDYLTDTFDDSKKNQSEVYV